MVVKMKTCYKCKIEQPETSFGKLKSSKDGLRYDCSDCRKKYRAENAELIKIKQKQYYDENRDELLEKNKLYRDNNIDKINLQRQQYRSQEHIKAHVKQKNAEYLPIKKEKIKQRRKTDLNFRLSEILRSKIHKMIKGRETTYKNLIGCDSEWFKKWIEYQFDENMSWSNLGTYWEIDHILPITQFNFENKEDEKICFNWTNYQPLEKKTNKKKSNKFELHYYFNSIVSVFRFDKNNNNMGYQAVNESLLWLRSKLRYGKNAPYVGNFVSLNGQSAAEPLTPL